MRDDNALLREVERRLEESDYRIAQLMAGVIACGLILWACIVLHGIQI